MRAAIATGPVLLGFSAAAAAAVLALIGGLLVACTTSPLGRSQLKLMPESQMDQMGTAAFAQMVEQTPPSSDARTNAYVVCVAKAVTNALTGPEAKAQWEVRVFQDDSANAFALPGGKIGVHTGLLAVAKTQDQLATVLGHEVAHVRAGHSNERVSAEFATQAALSLVQALSDPANPMHAQMMGLLGVGAQVGVLLPYSRTHESEADLIGLDLMATAGFDPRESVALWRNMSAAAGAQPPEFLSTHPANESRIRELEQRVPHALELYEAARARGRRPACK